MAEPTTEPIKRVLMEITLLDEGKLEWFFDPDMNVLHMYAMYGLLELIRQQLEIDFHEDFEQTGGE